MKTIDTIVKDIYKVLENGSWFDEVTPDLSKKIARVLSDRFSEIQQPRRELSMSSLGTPCIRKLWYKSKGTEGTPLDAEALGTFLYGDILEAVVVALAKCSGHTIEADQEELEIDGIKGHPDGIFDGMLVDVKSASGHAMKKFYNNGLLEEDPFGYLSQLSSYLYALQDDPRLIVKNKAAFLAVNKERFKLSLDIYDLTDYLARKPQEIEEIKRVTRQQKGPKRLLPVADGKNKKLPTACSYCEFRRTCWPEARTFLYKVGNGFRPVYLTDVVKEPRVTEIIE